MTEKDTSRETMTHQGLRLYGRFIEVINEQEVEDQTVVIDAITFLIGQITSGLGDEERARLFEMMRQGADAAALICGSPPTEEMN